MSNPVEIKVNVINQLKLLRQSTFKDKLSFLDEDIQNAQRAKATEVKVTVDYNKDKVTIENNGKILLIPRHYSQSLSLSGMRISRNQNHLWDGLLQ